MTLQSSGPISLGQIRTEFKGTTSLSAYYRGRSYVLNNLSENAGIPVSGPISLSQFYGTKGAFKCDITISANCQNYNAIAACIAAGWDQVRPLIATITIVAGVIVSSSSVGTPAFTVNRALPLGSIFTVINYGAIVGKGGNGGAAGSSFSSMSGAATPGVAGTTGGPALSTSAAITIYNYGTIGGGGGGGGGGSGGAQIWRGWSGGGGGGGGAGYGLGGTGGTYNAYGGYTYGPGQPGAPGSSVTAGLGGAPYWIAGHGGNGGALGSVGTAGVGTTNLGGAGGPAGAAVIGNMNITWAFAGSRLGSLT